MFVLVLIFALTPFVMADEMLKNVDMKTISINERSAVTSSGNTTIVYQSGPNLVQSTEYWNLWYEGYIQLTSSYNDNGWSRIRGYIRYYIPETDKDTGWVATEYSLNGELVSKTLKFQDVFWDAPKVRFVYRFDSVPYGSDIEPYALPDDIKAEVKEVLL